jgi:hypothetical protein
VTRAEPPLRLQLLSEVKAPGDALLDFTITPTDERSCELELTSRLLPRGLAGIRYWYGFLCFHHLVFRGMLAGILRAAGCRPLRGPERRPPPDRDVCFLPEENLKDFSG